MSAVCPSGHRSGTADFCDQCGARIGGAPARATADEVDTSTTARHEPCPACAAPRSSDDRFCEGCGYEFAVAPPPAIAAWEAVAAADRGQFERHASAAVVFPDAYPERSFPLGEALVRIGRTRGRPGEPVPEIDLAGTPQDSGISHMHAALERQPDGSYAVRDLGSTNGTSVNDDPAPIAAEASVRLGDGDRLRIGAWTRITLRRV